MAFRNVPEKKYRLMNGTLGTVWECLREVLRMLEARQRSLEENIEITRLQMQTAEGRPVE